MGAREIANAPMRLPTSSRGPSPPSVFLLALLAYAAVAGASFVPSTWSRTRGGSSRSSGLSLLALPWTLNWLFQGLDRMAWVGLAQPVRMLTFAVGVVAVVAVPEHLWRVGVVEIVAAWAMAFYYLVVQRACDIPIRLSFSLGPIRRLFREALPLATSQMLWALNHYSPMVMIGALVGGAEVGWLGGALRIVISVHTFVWLYFFSIYPTLVRTAREPLERLQRFTERSLRATAWLGVTFALATTLLAEPVSRVAFGPRFGDAAGALSVLVWVIPISLLSGHARFTLIAYGHQRGELLSAAAGTVVTLGLGYWLIPRLGAVGASITVVVSALVVWVVAHMATLGRIGRIAFFAPAIRPLAVAVLALAAVWWLPADGAWLKGGLASVLCLLVAPVVDRSLTSDIRRLLSSVATRGAQD